MRETRRLFHCDDAGAHDSRNDVTATLLVSRKAHAFIDPWIRDTTISAVTPLVAVSEAAATIMPGSRARQPFAGDAEKHGR